MGEEPLSKHGSQGARPRSTLIAAGETEAQSNARGRGQRQRLREMKGDVGKESAHSREGAEPGGWRGGGAVARKE